jgi:hypothetical protein
MPIASQRITVLVEVIDKATRQLKKIDKFLSNFGRRFRMHALGMMFFGMALQRFFLGFGRTGAEALIKVTEGATAQARALIGLQAEWQFLQISVGDAIGEFLKAHPEFMQFIENISEWIQQNRELVGEVMVWGAIIGTILMVFGMLDLAFVAMFKYFTDFYRLGKWAFKGVHKFALKFASGMRSVAASTAGQIGMLIVAFGLMYLAWENNVMGIKRVSMTYLAPVADFLMIVGQQLLYLVWAIGQAGKALGLQVDTAGIEDAIHLLGKARKALYTPAFQEYAMGQKPLTEFLTGAAGELGQVVGGILTPPGGNTVNIGDINVEVNEPVLTSGETDFDELAEKVKEKVAGEIAPQVVG